MKTTKSIKSKSTKKNSSTEKIKKNKSVSSIGSLKSNKSTDDNDLLSLLTEADKITLNDLDFDTILNEESKILCNINNLVNKQGKIKGQFDTKNKDNNPLCNIINSNSDSKIKNMISKYKKQLISKSKMSKTKKSSKKSKKTKSKKSFKSINLIKHKPTSIKYDFKKSRSKKVRSKKSRTKKLIRKKSITKKPIRRKSRTKKSSHKKSSHKKSIPKKNNNKKCYQINKIAIKNKNMYRYNNRRKIDVTITNPKILYIKNNSKNNKLKNKK